MNRFRSSPLLQFTAAAVVCVLAVAGYGLWRARVAALSAQVSGIESRIQAASEASTRLSSARVALAQLTSDEAAVQAYFVPEASVVSFIDALQASGKSLGVGVTVASVSATKVGGRSALDVSLTLTGSFDAIMRMVGAVEYAPYDVSVTNLAASLDQTKGWSATLGILVGSITGSSTPSTNTGTPAPSGTPAASTPGKVVPSPVSLGGSSASYL